ncbi:hypothetical protein F4808DRAFT_357332 [Astrocystis sublimbata]|nr:hypothetical protein F4808DRAFT_357332 [Astrocystis sublimbata]
MPLPFRIPVPIRGDGHNSLNARPILSSRQEPGLLPLNRRDNDSDNAQSKLIVVIVLIIAIIIFASAGFLFLRRRANQRRNYTQANSLEPYSGTTQNGNRRAASGGLTGVSETNRNSTTSNMNRNPSGRSIMTLPPYKFAAPEGERVIGRAGERDGIDVILELPSDEQHEALRDQEMNTMYEIRQLRRQQHAEREERQRLTTEARNRGDMATLEDLRIARRRAANDDSAIEQLREAQGQIRSTRERAVSSVSYHDLGVAKHDGSRIRANSTESERVGLLSDAASMAASTRSPSGLSNRRGSDLGVIGIDSRSPSAQSHHRMHSVGSVVSISNNGDASPPSGATTPRLGSSFHTRAGSSPEIITEADLGDSSMPPPDYEDLSLDDARSGATTPMFHGPPPDYSGHSLSNHEDDSGDLASPTDEERNRRPVSGSSRGVGGVPQLPSLRIRELPQIVIEPSTAYPSETGR